MQSPPPPVWRAIHSRLAPQSLRNYTSLTTTASRGASILRRSTVPRHRFAATKRYNSEPTVPGAPPPSSPERAGRDEPSYEISFICRPCLYRSTHRITKQGYHHGTVLITCPSCKSRHVISDHLKVFMDQKTTLEDILRQKAANGEDFKKLLKKGTLGIRPGNLVGNEGEENLEFWEDGTESKHQKIDEKQAEEAGWTKGSTAEG